MRSEKTSRLCRREAARPPIGAPPSDSGWRIPGFHQSRRFRHGGLLIGLIIVVLALSISLGVVMPRATLAVKRAKEDELRFILGEYRRGIEKFRARRGRNPQHVEELLRDEHGTPFIRRLYPDPMSGQRDWVLETANDQAFIRSNSSATSLAGVAYSAFR